LYDQGNDDLIASKQIIATEVSDKEIRPLPLLPSPKQCDHPVQYKQKTALAKMAARHPIYPDQKKRNAIALQMFKRIINFILYTTSTGIP
jgi:hypothetical protein